MTTPVITVAPAVREALLAAASLAEAQPNRTAALSAALRLLSRFPGTVSVWRDTVDPHGPSVALSLRASSPADVAQSLRDAAGGAL